MIQWPAKDPDEVADYSWQPSLDAGDSILSFTAAKSGSVEIDRQENTGSVATLWLSGGVAGEIVSFTLTITTSGGRSFEETAYLSIFNSSSLNPFRTRYPAFAATPDATVQMWIDEGALETAAWSDAYQLRGTMLYAAHKLAESGQGTDKGVFTSGVTSFKSGTFSATLTDSVASRTGLDATVYGREYLALARRQFSGPRLAWTPGHV